ATEYWATNTFEGGVGNDSLQGYWGGDTYLFNLGDGQDTIRDNGSYSSTGIYTDTLRFGAGISASDIQASRSGNDLVLAHANGNDKITVRDWFVSSNYWLETVSFADGTHWSAYDLTYNLAQAGTDAAQSLIGVSRSNALIRAGGGNDTIVSSDGNDELHGEAGDDTINAGSGNDTVYGGAGNDLIDGGQGDDVLEGGDGDDVISDASGTNVMRGGAGNDTLKATEYWATNTFEGGVGNDSLQGYWGGDTYLFNLGDGQDTIRDNGSYSSTGIYTDTLRFGAGIVQADVNFARVGDDLQLDVAGQGDQLLIKDWYKDSHSFKVENMAFADGSSLNSGQVDSLISSMASIAVMQSDAHFSPLRSDVPLL
ncbi:calcium-binding protein, partial [Lysobacter sp. 1R34A]|uniref:calcium-binding protein n=1 Tax=Lysobacter sp. 1R34A TaxID=3445786 RepID=UPI003EEF6CA6